MNSKGFLFLSLLLSVFFSATHGKTVPTTLSIDSANKVAFEKRHSDMAMSLKLLNQAELQCLKLNYRAGLTENYIYQGEVYNMQGYLKRADFYFKKALKLSSQYNDPYTHALAQEYSSSVERKNGNFIDAEVMLNRSLNVFTNLNKTKDVINTRIRLAVLQIKQKQYDDARLNLKNAGTLIKQINFPDGQTRYLYQTAELFSALQQPDSALAYYSTSLASSGKLDDVYYEALSYLGLGKIYLEKNDMRKSKNYATLAYRASGRVNVLLFKERSIEVLLNIATKQNDVNAIKNWQEQLVQITRDQNKIGKNEDSQFIEVLKQQQQRQLAVQQEFSGLKRLSDTKTIILICFFVLTIITVMLIFSLSYNYRRAKQYTAELSNKNHQIQEHSHSLDVLNKRISGQNAILEEDNELKNKLLSVISHDLRHPLTNTKSILDLVNLKLVSHEEAETLFAQLESQYGRAISLLDNLLYWIKSQVHGDKVEKTTNNLHDLVNSLIEEHNLAIQKKNISVENLLGTNIVWIAEREMLRIIFRNLLTNALKFTNSGGLIQFVAEVNEDCVKVSVKDDGIGMNEETLKKVSVESHHFTSKGTENEPGSGLGLMLIRDLIKKINGNLVIESTAGAGSTFSVCLMPVKEEVLTETEP